MEYQDFLYSHLATEIKEYSIDGIVNKLLSEPANEQIKALRYIMDKWGTTDASFFKTTYESYVNKQSEQIHLWKCQYGENMRHPRQLHFDRSKEVLQWLEEMKTDQQEPDYSKYTPNMLALFHLIKTALGKENQFIDSNSKSEIESVGKNKYGLNKPRGFYNGIRLINIQDMTATVRSMNRTERKNWKQSITELSQNDADIISWLKKQPE